MGMKVVYFRLPSNFLQVIDRLAEEEGRARAAMIYRLISTHPAITARIVNKRKVRKQRVSKMTESDRMAAVESAAKMRERKKLLRSDEIRREKERAVDNDPDL